ncbi:MAG: ABC transporter permease [Gaiellaceae bacterium]
MSRVLVFLSRRVIAGFFTLFVMVTLTFVVFWATPTQPALNVYPDVSHLTPYKVTHGNHLLGTDRPKLEQYLDDVPRLFIGRFGTMWEDAQITPKQTLVEYPIAVFLDPALRATLSLLVGGAVLVLLLAIPLGAFAGSRVGALSDRTISLVALIGICTHPMVTGILVRSLFHGRLHWLPPSGYCSLFKGSSTPCHGLVPWADHLAMPWITFALLFLALYVRMVRTSVAETLPQDYVRTARAKGAHELNVIGRHVLPNASLRVLTMIGMEVGTAIGVCIYIEAAYNINGLASLAVRELSGNSGALDLPVILGIVFVISAIVVAGNLIVDTLYVFFDPRASIIGPRVQTKAAAGGVI